MTDYTNNFDIDPELLEKIIIEFLFILIEIFPLFLDSLSKVGKRYCSGCDVLGKVAGCARC